MTQILMRATHARKITSSYSPRLTAAENIFGHVTGLDSSCTNRHLFTRLLQHNSPFPSQHRVSILPLVSRLLFLTIIIAFHIRPSSPIHHFYPRVKPSQSSPNTHTNPKHRLSLPLTNNPRYHSSQISIPQFSPTQSSASIASLTTTIHTLERYRTESGTLWR